MTFRIRGLEVEQFAHLFTLSDADPRAHDLHIRFAAPGCCAARVERA